ncbi:hypothetical protein [Poseidonocella sedimentorum]|uniref:Lipoprotein n=1 Tax=Poseidonocella sedimentorum TaxID=871652 RepID=A0A1I6EB93_9RHOB|nr:hypothetical protein [Poseidonocella sedimentorum]SFR14985.1 hypothetical protein SAMN04515673_10964 [Poseidonocella sedimentorum]
MVWRRLGALVLLGLCLAGCAADNKWAPDEVVDRYRYRHSGPPELALITVLNRSSGNGAHTALMISGSERVIFDPAGSFSHPRVPERHDVLFGVTPAAEAGFLDFHARETYDVTVQRLEVPAATAELALSLARANGPVRQAQCTTMTARLLSKLPGFESIRTTWFPDNLRRDFGKLPGVREEFIRDDDPDVKSLDHVEVLQ